MQQCRNIDRVYVWAGRMNVKEEKDKIMEPKTVVSLCVCVNEKVGKRERSRKRVKENERQ